MVKNPLANAREVRDEGSVPGSGRSPGGGHGNPLQYSCLENPRDRGAWRATVHGVTKSQTWLKWLSTYAQIYILHKEIYYITGKSKIWLCIGSFCAFVINIIITKRILSIAISVYNDLPQEAMPLCLTVKVPLFRSQRRHCDPAYLWMAAKKEEINTSPFRCWLNWRYFAKLIVFLLYILTTFPSLFYKRNWHPDPLYLLAVEDSSEFPWTARRSNQSILKEINPEYSLEVLMLKLKLQYFGHLM